MPICELALLLQVVIKTEPLSELPNGDMELHFAEPQPMEGLAGLAEAAEQALPAASRQPSQAWAPQQAPAQPAVTGTQVQGPASACTSCCTLAAARRARWAAQWPARMTPGPPCRAQLESPQTTTGCRRWRS